MKKKIVYTLFLGLCIFLGSFATLVVVNQLKLFTLQLVTEATENTLNTPLLTFTTKDTVIANFKAICDNNPTKASYISVGSSIQGKDILMFMFGNSSSTGRILWDSEMHGNEDYGTEAQYLIAQWLVSNDTRANRILKNNYVCFIPIVNIDTYNRQNMRRSYTYPDLTTIAIPYGVNLNRNFPTGWGGSGTANVNSSSDYRGPVAGSEPEAQALINVFRTLKPKFYLDCHQFGGPYLGYFPSMNTTLRNLVINRYQTYCSNFSVSAYSTRPCGVGGYAVTEANHWNISSWLIEIGPSSAPWLPVDQVRGVETTRLKALIWSMTEVCEVPSSEIVVPSESIISLLTLPEITLISSLWAILGVVLSFRFTKFGRIWN